MLWPTAILAAVSKATPPDAQLSLNSPLKLEMMTPCIVVLSSTLGRQKHEVILTFPQWMWTRSDVLVKQNLFGVTTLDRR